MLFVLLIWLLNISIVLSLGNILNSLLFKKDKRMPDFVLINGLFAYMLSIWVVLYFRGLGLNIQLFFVLFSFLYLFFHPELLIEIKNSLKNLSYHSKACLFLIGIVSLMLSSATSSIRDNETYYIQTIKWANEYGFFKGIINIHPFLGQFSGWHILQSGLNFPYKNYAFNDLNGLFFFIFVFYWLLQTQKKTREREYWLVLFPISSIFLIFFIDSPSPDLAVILLSFIVFDLFIKNYKRLNFLLFVEMLLLSGFSFLIKPTAIITLFLVLILWIHHYKQMRKKSLIIMLSFLFIMFLWGTKNYVITGYVFYPFHFMGNLFKPEWQYPQELMHYMSQLGKEENRALHFNSQIFYEFLEWLRQPGVHQVINSFFILLLILFPLILLFKKQSDIYLKPYWVIYLVGVSYFGTILFISPNFRFFLAIFLFLLLSLILFLVPKSFLKPWIAINWIFFLFMGFWLSFHHHFTYKNLLFPQSVSSIKAPFSTKNKKDLQYHYPADKQLFWETGNAPLPAVQPRQIFFFKKYFGFVPHKSKKNKYYYTQRNNP